MSQIHTTFMEEETYLSRNMADTKCVGDMCSYDNYSMYMIYVYGSTPACCYSITMS